MLRQTTSEDERERSRWGRDATDERQQTGGPLQTGVLFAAAFVAGFLFGRRSEGGSDAQSGGDERSGLADVVTEVRERITDSEGSGEGTSDRTGEETGSEPTPPETGGIDADVADYEPPTTRGMPMLGMGTPEDEDYETCLKSVRRGLQVGYRHIDAIERRESYYSEEAVGDAIHEAHASREDLFLATKVDPEDLDHGDVFHSVEESLDHLDVEYLDLLYVHWPTGEYDAAETLSAFAELRQEGLIEEIGVSNFTVDLLEEAIEVCEEPIFANQVEMHPLLPQTELREFCQRDDVDVELVAYSPIARAEVENVDEIREVAQKHGATPEQVSLAWLREKGVTAIPESTDEQHLRENWLSLAVDLDEADVRKLDSIEERRRIVDPEDAPWNQG